MKIKDIGRSAGSQSWWWILAAVLTVGSLTLGQTILDIVGDAPEFFVAKRMTPIEIILSAVLVVISPLVLVVPVLVVRMLSARAAGILLSVILGVLMGSLAIYTLDRFEYSATVTLLGAGVVALSVGSLYLLSGTVQSFVRYLSPAPLVIVAMFVFVSPVSALINSEGESGAPVSGSVKETPVVLIVFDELPLSSLMNGSGALVADAYPSFAKLAADGVWYRNAATLTHQTSFAVPSIATGIQPDRELLPTASDHPDSIFSALRRSHDLRVLEALTAICPEDVCRRDEQAMTEKLSSLMQDLGIVGSHVVIPEALSGELPPIDQNWGNFSSPTVTDPEQYVVSAFRDQSGTDRRLEIARFADLIGDSSQRPPLLFGHFLLPHAPWQFLQDGTRIEGRMPPMVVERIVVEDRWKVALGQQRFLHMVHYVDSALGQIITDLENAGLYERALILVVADHGASFLPGLSRRDLVNENTSELIPIPLFVKYPAGLEQAPPPGSIDDVRAEIADVVPTIFEALGAEPPYEMDGVSLLDVDMRRQRTETVIPVDGGELTYPIDLQPALDAAGRFDVLFPTRNPEELMPAGTNPDLIGTSPEVVDVEGVRVNVGRTEVYENLDLEAEPFPAVVYASVRGAQRGQPVGIMVDGQIVTLTQVYINDNGNPEASGMIPKDALHEGDNEVSMVLINDDGSVVE